MIIQALPEELLLAVLHQLPSLPKHRRRALVAVSHVNRLFRRLAQDELLTQPIVHVFNVHHIVRTYLEYPHLSEKVTELELLTDAREGFRVENYPMSWHPVTASSFAPVLDEDFRKACEKIIYGTTVLAQSKATWIEDLQLDHLNAFLCILFVILPKLKSLRLGTGTMDYFPFLRVTMNKGWSPLPEENIEDTCKELGLSQWTSNYPCEVFEPVSTRLNYLEFPLDLGYILNVLHGTSISLRDWTSLKHLSISHDTLRHFGLFDYLQDMEFVPCIPISVLPECLKTITVLMNSEYNMGENNFRRSLSVLKRYCASLNRVSFVYTYGLSHTTCQQQGIVEYEHGLGLEIANLRQPEWPLYAFKLNARIDLYDDPSWDSFQSRDDLFVYESRECYSELARLQENLDQGEREPIRDEQSSNSIAGDGLQDQEGAGDRSTENS